jgi:hypothetical protein
MNYLQQLNDALTKTDVEKVALIKRMLADIEFCKTMYNGEAVVPSLKKATSDVEKSWKKNGNKYPVGYPEKTAEQVAKEEIQRQIDLGGDEESTTFFEIASAACKLLTSLEGNPRPSVWELFNKSDHGLKFFACIVRINRTKTPTPEMTEFVDKCHEFKAKDEAAALAAELAAKK